MIKTKKFRKEKKTNIESTNIMTIKQKQINK